MGKVSSVLWGMLQWELHEQDDTAAFPVLMWGCPLAYPGVL